VVHWFTGATGTPLPHSEHRPSTTPLSLRDAKHDKVFGTDTELSDIVIVMTEIALRGLFMTMWLSSLI
jgi:hypothetical protein